MTEIYELKEICNIAKEIISMAKYKIILFYGEMGSGKTTLIKEIVKQLGGVDVVNSPTFSLVNEYHTHKGDMMYHFDFYRIKSEEEALDIGIEEYFYSDNWCFVEWPDKVENLLPLESVEIHLTICDNNKRSIQIN
jgi:tRNA threonylcarbamoyladenosine biosynthesis protein TsaE